MKTPLACTVALTALLLAGGARAGPGPDLDFDNDAGFTDVEPADMDMVRHPDGTLITRETYMARDGSMITRTTVREPVGEQPLAGAAVELTPAQRRLIWHTVAVPVVRTETDDLSALLAELPPPLVREHIEATPGPRSYRVGSHMPDPSALQPLPDSVTVAVPSVQDHLYTVVEQRVLLVDPATSKVVAEVVR